MIQSKAYFKRDITIQGDSSTLEMCSSDEGDGCSYCREERDRPPGQGGWGGRAEYFCCVAVGYRGL